MSDVNKDKQVNSDLAGDQLRSILIEHLPVLRRFAYALTHHKADADDLVQALAEKLLKTGLPAGINALPWMLKVGKNLWIDEIRRRKTSRFDHTESTIEKLAVDGEKALLKHIGQQQVLAAVAKLSESHRSVLTLISVGGLSYAEAAEIEGVPVGTIMSRLARAREHLCSLLRIREEQGNE